MSSLFDKREPYGYAVVMDDGAGLFVGCYRTREMAQSVRDKQPPSHNDVVVQIEQFDKHQHQWQRYKKGLFWWFSMLYQCRICKKIENWD